MEDEYKYQHMQDEMSRFEAEIATERPSRTPIGSATYGIHQRMQQGPSSQYGNVPPPPLIPSLFLPSPLQKSRTNTSNPSNCMNPPNPNPINTSNSSNSYSTSNSSSPPPIPPLLQSKPQPAVLSGAPQLYNVRMDKLKKKDLLRSDMLIMREYEAPAPIVPIMTPTLPPTAAEAAAAAAQQAAIASSNNSHKHTKKEKKNRKVIRTAGGQVWEDLSLNDWPDDDFRLFCGDLGNDVTDELLIRTFSKYTSFSRAKVIRDKRTNKSKGFGFISFREPADFIKAMKEMNGRYVGSRPIKLRKSTWRARSLDVVRKKEKEKAALISMLTGGTQKS